MMHGLAHGSGVDVLLIVAIAVAVLALVGTVVLLEIRRGAARPRLHRRTDALPGRVRT